MFWVFGFGIAHRQRRGTLACRINEVLDRKTVQKTMKNLIEIREYSETDKSEVLILLRQNTPRYFAVEEELEFIEYIENRRGLYYVVQLEDKIVGCGGINFDKNIGKISWDMISPSVQGLGLGSALLKHRIQKIKENKLIDEIIVRTSQHTFQFYEKQGFELIEMVKDYWALGFDLYYMKYLG